MKKSKSNEESMSQYVETFADGTVITRPWNEEELAQFEKDRIDNEERELAVTAAKNAREAAMQSAISKLSALGLDESEIQAVIGSSNASIN
jgi:hypothetical protein